MDSIDASALIGDTVAATDASRFAHVMDALAVYAKTNHAGAQIRQASPLISALIAGDGCAAWVIARFGEPAVVVLCDDLLHGKGSWHAARMLVALGDSVLQIEPGQVGILRGLKRPNGGWDDPAEMRIDGLAAAALFHIGISRRTIRRIQR